MRLPLLNPPGLLALALGPALASEPRRPELPPLTGRTVFGLILLLLEFLQTIGHKPFLPALLTLIIQVQYIQKGLPPVLFGFCHAALLVLRDDALALGREDLFTILYFSALV
jgi:hypothetical protein